MCYVDCYHRALTLLNPLPLEPWPMSTTSGIDSSPSMSNKLLFWASFMTLIAAGIGFSVRGVILKDWGQQFGFTQSELGTITGGGLAGFGVAIIFFSFFADLFGYGKLMLVAFLLHAFSAIVTFAATPVYEAYGKDAAYWCLFTGMLLFALGNGTCEAVINPLTATLFPKKKTHWLNILHAGWPLGLILGVVITLGFEQVEQPIRWEFKLGAFLVPVVLYGLLMFNRQFPRSEAHTAGIPLTDMMGRIGMIGFAVAAAFFGILLVSNLPDLFKALNMNDVPGWIGWAVAGVIWLIFTVTTRFAFGSILLAILYILHSLVGYVELGTDTWITNITTSVLKSPTNAQLAFIWTNALMFVLRFFAGPIVHRINPIGLLLVSAIFGTLGLYMLGMGFTDSIWPWIGAVTIYGLGKTFYWPTMLGVISERFPRGGALALGIAGGIGMLSAGLLGGPGIGYKQDYFTVEKLEETSPETYERYKADSESGYPIVSKIDPEAVPMIAGIDNKKYRVFEDYKKFQAGVATAKEEGKSAPVEFDDYTKYVGAIQTAKDEGKEPPAYPTTLESDLATIDAEKAAGNPVEEQLEKQLRELNQWWVDSGRPNFEKDAEYLPPARDFGGKTALKYTAAVPAILAVGYLLLLLYFSATGGYSQVNITDDHGGMSQEATPK